MGFRGGGTAELFGVGDASGLGFRILAFRALEGFEKVAMRVSPRAWVFGFRDSRRSKAGDLGLQYRGGGGVRPLEFGTRF